VEAREELARADSKATTLLSVTGLIIGALLAGAIAGNWNPERLDNAVEWAFWVGLAAIGAAEGSLCLAVLPRVQHEKTKETLRYFGHVVQFESRAELAAALAAADDEEDRQIDQVYKLSEIVDRKYRYVWFGLVASFGGALLCGAAVLVDQLIRA
jgi:MFS family permease